MHGIGPAENPPSQPPRVQRIEPVAEQRDRRRCHHDRGDGRERHHRDARVGERLQEVHREQHHRDHRQRDRHRREQHGPARGRHGADQRAVAVGAVGEFVAVSADDQQRVVDGQRQAHRDGQVQREDRHVGDQRDGPQHRHRTQDREAADGQRQRRGDQAAEHPDQHDEAERNRDGFHCQQVFLALIVDLDIGHRLAARAHGDAVAVVDESVGQLLGVLLGLALAAGDARDDQPGLAVLADQRWRGRTQTRSTPTSSRATYGDAFSCSAMSVPTDARGRRPAHRRLTSR